MTALLSLLNTYAIFFYLAGVLFVLLGIKMLFDARRAGRTTLFTLEQEQASDRAFRAVLVMLGAILFIGAIAGINAFVGPVVPTATPDVIEPTVVPFTPPVILPTSTPQPTETPLPPTAAPTSAAVQVTATATVPSVAQPTATAGASTPTVAPTAVPPTKSALIYPQPPLNTPPDGDSIGANNIRFSWGFNQAAGAYDVPETLPPDQFYRIVVTYTSQSQNKEAAIVVCTHDSSVDRKSGLDLTDYRGEAVDGAFKWNVTAVRSASQQACESGDFAPLSPTSSTSSFRLP